MMGSAFGCKSDRSPSSAPSTPSDSTPNRGSDNLGVTVYCSVDAAFAEPILAEFERRTGITVHHVFDTEAGKTTGLVNRLLGERKSPRADVWWSSEIFGTIQLASDRVLAKYKPDAADDIPEPFRDPGGRWTAFGLRGRVLAYDPKRTKRENVPRRWADIPGPLGAGRFRMADPRFGTTRGHVATMISLWGENAVADLFKRLHEGGVRLCDGNAQAVLQLSRGMADVVATDTDDVIVARERGDSIEMIYPDMDDPDGARPVAGTLWIPNSVGLVRGGPDADAGRALIDYLVSPEIEDRLHQSESRNIPVRPALCEKLGLRRPPIADIDYPAAAEKLEIADRLVRDELLAP